MEISLENYTQDGEILVELACRNCYQSFNRFNPPDSTKDLIPRVIQQGHHSVLEHASATFLIKGVSRALTHELCRHRHFSFSQESQRYVNYCDKPATDQAGIKGKARKKTKDFTYYTPQDIAEMNDGDFEERTIGIHGEGWINTEVLNYQTVINLCYEYYEFLLSKGIKPEDARYVLPNAACSDIYVSGNIRTWRHFLMLRCHPKAMTEIRELAHRIKDVLKEKFPNCFWDFPDGVLNEEDFSKIIPT